MIFFGMQTFSLALHLRHKVNLKISVNVCFPKERIWPDLSYILTANVVHISTDTKKQRVDFQFDIRRTHKSLKAEDSSRKIILNLGKYDEEFHKSLACYCVHFCSSEFVELNKLDIPLYLLNFDRWKDGSITIMNSKGQIDICLILRVIRFKIERFSELTIRLEPSDIKKMSSFVVTFSYEQMKSNLLIKVLDFDGNPAPVFPLLSTKSGHFLIIVHPNFKIKNPEKHRFASSDDDERYTLYLGE